ncbi:MAG: TIGR01777 family oxidoreductase [Bacteroidia bacterium]|nr:TIGR01777 family oxidoreductase [Bacteroidia bacterium]
MNILITGGTGYIGGFLILKLLEKGHQVSILTRSAKKSTTHGMAYLQWDGKEMPFGMGIYDAVINLAGANIGKLSWTEENKKLFRDSRINATKACVNYINRSPNPPSVFVSGSAVGFYGIDREEVVDESSSYKEDFLGILSKEWEEEALKAKCRTVILRTGVVIGKGSEVTERLKPLYQFHLGGKIGTGKQGFPWIHIEDEVKAIIFALENDDLDGPINLVGPELLTQKEFSNAFAKALGVTDIWTIPGFAMSLALGKEKSGIVTGGQHVVPKKLTESGFEFEYKTALEALIEILG